jgi:hypothetical protein
MLTRFVGVVATTVLLSAPIVAEAAPTVDARAGTNITGAWKGGVYGDDGGPAGYTAKVTITKKHGTYKGTVSYPGQCSGKWVYQGKKHGWFTFREVITHGSDRCVSPVAAKAKRTGAKLKVVWREPTTGDTGHMTAKRR